MRSDRQNGFILKRSNFGEADKILTVFTRENGKIRLLAKGIRRIKSRRAPHLELFNEVSLLTHRGRTFSVVTEAKTVNNFSRLKQDLKISGYLYYLAEILDKILPDNQPHPEVLTALISLLSRLDIRDDSEARVKTFVVQLLWQLGYLPNGHYPKIGVTASVEEIVERPIRSKKFLGEL